MKRGLGTIVTGVVLFVAGAFVVPGIMIFSLILDREAPRQFLVPGSVDVTVEKPGRYFHWNNHQTIFEGRTYDTSESLPGGLVITITDERGQKLPFIPDGSMSNQNGAMSKKSIGYVEVTASGRLHVSVEGNSDNRVFSFAPSDLMKILGWMFGGMGAGVLLAIAGVAVGIIGIVRMASAKPQGHV
jgi:hypothetical protein